MEIIFFLGRLLFGGFFIHGGIQHFTGLKNMAGYAKSQGVPAPEAAVALSGAMIIAGGTGVILGIMPRVSLGLIGLFLVVVTFYMHAFWKEKDSMAKMNSQIGFMKNMALLGATLTLYALWP